MKNLFRSLFPNKQQDAIKVQVVHSTKLMLDQWRKDESLVTAMAQLEKNPTFTLAVQCLRNSHLCRISLPLGCSPDDRVAHQARTEGYEACLKSIESLAVPFKVQKPIEATFEKP